MSCSALCDGNAREASGHDVLMYGRALKGASLGSWDMYSLARRGRVMGLQCMTLLILKHCRTRHIRCRVCAMILRILGVDFVCVVYVTSVIL